MTYVPEQARFEEIRVCRSICDGQRGYTTTRPNGVSLFHFTLGDLFRDILHHLDHKEDRDVMVIGEPEKGNAW